MATVCLAEDLRASPNGILGERPSSPRCYLLALGITLGGLFRTLTGIADWISTGNYQTRISRTWSCGIVDGR